MLYTDYLKKLNVIQKRCPKARVVLDAQINWNEEFASQIAKTSIKTIVKNLLSQTLSSKSRGIGIIHMISLSAKNNF